MNSQEYKELLRKKALISDAKWNPTDNQIKLIQSEIDKYVRSGTTINISILQQIITSVCGPIQSFIFESVDNSDLNALLLQAALDSNSEK